MKEIYNANGELVPSLVEGLLKSSMDIDSIDRAADENLLMHAAKIGNLRFVKLLISKNAKINVKNVFFYIESRRKRLFSRLQTWTV